MNEDILVRYSGTIAREILMKLKTIADNEDRSLNYTINKILKEYCQTTN